LNSEASKVRRRGFALLLSAQIAIYGYLILGRRLPCGHDTFSVFLLQYLFLAGPVSGGTGALWMPYLAHGVTSTWFSSVQSGLLQNVLLLVGGVPEGTPMLPVFYAGLFIEDLVLMIGVWRLSGRLYRSASAQVFVAAAALGSSMWISNIFWAHRLIYLVPLALSLLLDFLETGSRGRLLLAASCGGLLFLGNAVYIPVLSTLSIALFAGLYLWIHRKRLRAMRPRWRPRPVDAAWILAMFLVTGVAIVTVTADLGSICQYHRGRNPDGSVSLDSFLTYGGSLNPLRYLDFLFGINPSKDYSIYVGLCPLILTVVAFARRPTKDLLVVALTGLLLFFFSMGYLNGTAMLGFLAIPPLHFFRYISLASGLVKLFLVLVSGFGVDALIRDRRRPGSESGRLRLAAIAGGSLLAQWIYLWIRGESRLGPLDTFFWALRDNLVQRTSTAGFNFQFGLLVLGIGGGVLIALWRRQGRIVALGIPLLLLIHGADLVRWRIQLLREETVPLSGPQALVLRLSPLSFIERRTLLSVQEPLLASYPQMFSGERYDYGDAFLRRDVSWSPGFVTQWSPYMDYLLRAHAGRSLRPDPDIPPPFVSGGPTPRTLPESFARVIGESTAKLQVFSAGHLATSDSEIAALMNRPDYEGNTLLLSPASDRPGAGLDAALAGRNERLDAPWRVLEFSADRLRLTVDVPPDRSDAWLVYCDAWHPGWTASVDSLPLPVERANLAYKAVRLHSGLNTVEFRFRAPLRSLCYWIQSLQCLLWILLLGVWSLRFLGIRIPPDPPENGSHGDVPCYNDLS
jgi:hypothetical protein